MFDDYPVKYLPDLDVAQAADETRRRLFGPYLPGIKMLEGLKRFKGLNIVPQQDELLGDYDAYVSVNPKRIFCKQSAYDGMSRGEVEASGIFAHELGHYVLHPAKEIRFLATGGNKAPFSIPPNESAERQAWLFADAFQMPSWCIWQVETALELVKLCNVPLNRAERRWRRIRQNRNPASGLQPKCSAEQVWELAEQIPGEDPDIFRKSGIYRIAKAEFKMMSQCGWSVQDGVAVAWLTLEQQW